MSQHLCRHLLLLFRILHFNVFFIGRFLFRLRVLQTLHVVSSAHPIALGLLELGTTLNRAPARFLAGINRLLPARRPRRRRLGHILLLGLLPRRRGCLRLGQGSGGNRGELGLALPAGLLPRFAGAPGDATAAPPLVVAAATPRGREGRPTFPSVLGLHLGLVQLLRPLQGGRGIPLGRFQHDIASEA